MTDAEGRYRFVTIKPGAYPWRNHPNAWRPAHIHFSLFGRAFTQRLITQMYFPGDPLFAHDPIFNSVPDPTARQRLISRFDLALTEPDWALGYAWDIVLRGRGGDRLRAARRTPVTGLPLTPVADRRAVPRHRAALAGRPVRGARGHRRARSPSPAGCSTAPGTRSPDALVETWQADPDGRFAHPDDPRGAAAHGAGFRGFGRCPTGPDGATGSSRSSRARCPARTAAGRRRTWTSPCSPAACSTGS